MQSRLKLEFPFSLSDFNSPYRPNSLPRQRSAQFWSTVFPAAPGGAVSHLVGARSRRRCGAWAIFHGAGRHDPHDIPLPELGQSGGCAARRRRGLRARPYRRSGHVALSESRNAVDGSLHADVQSSQSLSQEALAILAVPKISDGTTCLRLNARARPQPTTEFSLHRERMNRADRTPA